MPAGSAKCIAIRHDPCGFISARASLPASRSVNFHPLERQGDVSELVVARRSFTIRVPIPQHIRRTATGFPRTRHVRELRFNRVTCVAAQTGLITTSMAMRRIYLPGCGQIPFSLFL